MQQEQTSIIEIDAGGFDWAWQPEANVATTSEGDMRVTIPGTVEPSLTAVTAFLEGWSTGLRQGMQNGMTIGAERARSDIRKALGVMSCTSVDTRFVVLEDADDNIFRRLVALERAQQETA